MRKELAITIGILVLLFVGVFYFVAERNPLMWQTLPFVAEAKEKKTEKLENIIWKKAEVSGPWEARDSHTVYEWQGKLYLLGGLDGNDTLVNGVPVYEKAPYFNDIWSSEDGMHWKREVEHAEFAPIRSASVEEINGALYLIGGWSPEVGYKNGIWKSVDAIHWTRVSDAPLSLEREGQKIIKFKDIWYLIGGVDYFARKTFNDVWSTKDGVHWELVTASAPWHSRWDFDVQVFQNKIWLVGGMNFAGVGYGDIWTTDNGRDWTYAGEAPMGKKQGQELVLYRDALFIIGGLDADTNEGYDKTYYTTDGVNWQKTIMHHPWLSREDHEVRIFKDKIWFFGGMDSDWKWTNDIWCTDFIY